MDAFDNILNSATEQHKEKVLEQFIESLDKTFNLCLQLDEIERKELNEWILLSKENNFKCSFVFMSRVLAPLLYKKLEGLPSEEKFKAARESSTELHKIFKQVYWYDSTDIS